MADIVFSGDSDFSKIQKDFDDLSRRTARLEKENYRLKQSADKQADSFGKARGQQGSLLTQGITGITQMVAGYVSLQAAIQLVTSAIQEQRAAQKDTLDAQVGQAAADATLIQNLVGISAQQKKDTIATLENLTVDLGIESATAVKAGFNEAISKAAGDVDLAMDATKRAAELQRATPENLPTFAAGGAVLSKLIGTRDTREAYGLLAEVQARSPVSDPKELMQELPGALAAMTATDARGAGRDSVREAAALMAAMGQATQQRAAPTSTAAIQLTSQLEKFFKAGTADLDAKIAKLQDRAGKIAIGGVKGPHEEAAMRDVRQQLREVRAQKAAVEVADPGTLAGRIEAIQKSQALQARILPTLTGEAKFLPAMRQLLEGRESEITTQFRKNIASGAAGGMQVGPQQFDILAKELGGQSEVSGAVRQQATVAQRAARGEANQLADDTGAALAQIREEFSQAMGQSSRTWNQRLETGVLEKTFAAFQGGDPGEAAKLADELLMERIARIRNNEWTGVAGSIRMGISGLKTDEELTPDEAQRVGALESSRLAIRRAAAAAARPGSTRARAPRATAGETPGQPPPPAGVDLSALKTSADQQVAELQATRKSIEKMGEQFARTAARMSGVAARAQAVNA